MAPQNANTKNTYKTQHKNNYNNKNRTRNDITRTSANNRNKNHNIATTKLHVKNETTHPTTKINDKKTHTRRIIRSRTRTIIIRRWRTRRRRRRQFRRRRRRRRPSKVILNRIIGKLRIRRRTIRIRIRSKDEYVE